GHKGEFEEWTDTVVQEAVIDLVNVGKIVDGLSLRIFLVHPHLIVENSVEADIFHLGRLLHLAQVTAIAAPQRQYRPAGPEHALPRVRKRVARRPWINLDRLRLGLLGAVRPRTKQDDTDCEQENAEGGMKPGRLQHSWLLVVDSA